MGATLERNMETENNEQLGRFTTGTGPERGEDHYLLSLSSFVKIEITTLTKQCLIKSWGQLISREMFHEGLKCAS